MRDAVDLRPRSVDDMMDHVAAEIQQFVFTTFDHAAFGVDKLKFVSKDRKFFSATP